MRQRYRERVERENRETVEKEVMRQRYRERVERENRETVET